MNKNITTKAALYLRVEPTNKTASGILQMEESFMAQEKICREFCKTHGIEISDEHVYRDVCSGSLAVEQRSELKKLFQATDDRHDFDIVIVSKLDRLARNTDILFSVLDRLAQEGIGLRSSTEQFNTEAGGGIIVRLLGAIAQMEREVLNKRKCECSHCC